VLIANFSIFTEGTHTK